MPSPYPASADTCRVYTILNVRPLCLSVMPPLSEDGSPLGLQLGRDDDATERIAALGVFVRRSGI